jgi:hypothetical protein
MHWADDWVHAELIRYGFGEGSVLRADWRFITIGDVAAVQKRKGIGYAEVQFGSSDVGVTICCAQVRLTQGSFLFSAPSEVQIYRHTMGTREGKIPSHVLAQVERERRTVSNS